MKNKHSILIANLIILISSCQNAILTEGHHLGMETNIHGELGKKLDNPYSLKNMKKAIKLLMSIEPSADYPGAENLEPTHLYVRFLPENSNELSILEKDSKLIYDPVPFGYENTLAIAYYHDPSIPEHKITWLYAFVPVNYTFPNVRHEILEQIYRPDEEENELEVLALKLTGNLKNEVIDGKEIMASHLTDIKLLGLFSKRYNPQGTIHVQNSFGGSVPLKNASIYIKTLWWNDVTYTNADGYYIVHRGYKDIPSVYLWNRNWTNFTTQRWTEHAGFWISDKLGEGKTFNYTIAHDTGKKRDLWVKSTINNAYVIYDAFTSNHNLKRPTEVKTWVFKNSLYGGAPLLHNQTLTSYSYFYPSIAFGNNENFGSVTAKTGIYALSPLMDDIIANTIKHSQLPEIIIGTKDKNTSEIYAMVFHEAAHYSHKGNLNNAYWANVQYQAMFDKTTGTYGDGTPTYAKYTGVAEAWSNFIEYELMAQNNLLNKERYNSSMTAYFGSPATIPSSSGAAADEARWIPSGLLRDLMDDDKNTINLRSGANYTTTIKTGLDKVSGFTYKQIYDLLTIDVTSINRLKTKIISQYSYKNTNNEITELFALYGY